MWYDLTYTHGQSTHCTTSHRYLLGFKTTERIHSNIYIYMFTAKRQLHQCTQIEAYSKAARQFHAEYSQLINLIYNYICGHSHNHAPHRMRCYSTIDRNSKHLTFVLFIIRNTGKFKSTFTIVSNIKEMILKLLIQFHSNWQYYMLATRIILLLSKVNAFVFSAFSWYQFSTV